MSPEFMVQKPIREGSKCTARVYTGANGVTIEPTPGYKPVCLALKVGVSKKPGSTGEAVYKVCHNPGGVAKNCPAEIKTEKILPFSSPKTPSRKQAA